MRTPFHAALFSSAAIVVGLTLAFPDATPRGVLAYLAAAVVAGAVAALVRATPSAAELDRVAPAVLRLEEASARALAEHAAARMPALDVRRRHDELLRALAHELKTPLNSIRGFAEVLESELDGPLPADAREEVALIKDAGEYLHSLVDEVLDVAAGRAVRAAALSPVDLGALVRDVARLVEPRASAKGLEVRTTGTAAAPTIRVDARRVRQILVNLGGNAVKYTSTGFVAFDVSTTADEVVVSVADSGPGIAAADRERIFSAWERAAGAAEGHGLGLAIARELASSIDARIELETELGRGSTFRLHLPVAPIAQADAGRTAS